MAVKEVVAKVTEQMGDLPALSTVVTEVLRMTEDPNTSTGDVCEVVQSDPGLTAKVLRVSNSSYYGMRQYVGTLKLALVILGVREVRNIVEGCDLHGTIFRSNHASNYLPLAGRFPQDRDRMLAELDAALAGETPLRPEFLRGL